MTETPSTDAAGPRLRVAHAPLARAPRRGRVGLVFNGVWSHYAFATAPKYRDVYELVYVHDLSYERVREFDALVIPFQSNHAAIAERRDAVYRLLADGKTVAVFGDTSPEWIDARWEWGPTNNWWWVEDPTRPPIAHTDFTHPLFKGLAQRHACWHTHGAYTRLSPAGRVLQLSDRDEAITWETHEYGGTLLASTLDPVVEHGVQQIRHLDHFCDNMTEWLCGVRPAGRLALDPAAYGRPWVDPAAARAAAGR